jgi:hypothetical protein
MQRKEFNELMRPAQAPVETSVPAAFEVNLAEEIKSPLPYGNGSVAHQIIGEFVDSLGKDDAYAEIAKRLGALVFSGRVTEADLRTAIFGEIDL